MGYIYESGEYGSMVDDLEPWQSAKKNYVTGGMRALFSRRRKDIFYTICFDVTFVFLPSPWLWTCRSAMKMANFLANKDVFISKCQNNNHSLTIPTYGVPTTVNLNLLKTLRISEVQWYCHISEKIACPLLKYGPL